MALLNVNTVTRTATILQFDFYCIVSKSSPISDFSVSHLEYAVALPQHTANFRAS